MSALIRSILGRRKEVRQSAIEAGVADSGTDALVVKELRARGRYGDAMQALQSALNGNPSNVDLKIVHADLLVEWGRVREARSVLETVVDAGLSDGQKLALGKSLLSAGCATEAARVFANVRGEDCRAAQRGRSIALRSCGRYGEAVMVTQDALRDAPGDMSIALAGCLANVALGDFGAAARSARQVLTVTPNSSLANFVLGTALREEGQFGESAEMFRRALHGDAPAALPHGGFVDLAVALETTGGHSEALQVLRQGIVTCPTPELHRTYGQMLLRAGQFREGWEQYEFRWFMEPLLRSRMRGDLPPWRGDAISGKVILLRIEQGLGDTIQFMRYATSLKALGARVVVGTIDLADSYLGVDGVLGRDFAPSDIDYYANLMSLPLVFGTEVESIPAPIPYVRAFARRDAPWSHRLDARRHPRVALVWAGNPGHPEDRYRSASLAALSPLLDVAGVEFYSLQKVLPKEGDREAMNGLGITDLGPFLQSFEDTASILCEIDLLISVDTSVAHLAGAMGKPVWLLSAYPGEWRWMGQMDTTPWYPTMRIFRQAKRGDWTSVVDRVIGALSAWRDGGEESRAEHGYPFVVPAISPPLTSFARDTGHVLNYHDVLLQYRPAADFVGACLEKTGAYQQIAVEVSKRLLTIGMTVLEASAGVGHHTVQLARMVGEIGHVVAFERDELTARLLKQNLEANGAANVSVVTRQLQARCDERGDRIDDLGLSGLDLIKFDRTIHLLQVLRGAEESVWRHRPRILVDYAGDEVDTAILTWLADHGYRVWRLPVAGDDESVGVPAGALLIALPEEANEEDRLPSAATECAAAVD